MQFNAKKRCNVSVGKASTCTSSVIIITRCILTAEGRPLSSSSALVRHSSVSHVFAANPRRRPPQMTRELLATRHKRRYCVGGGDVHTVAAFAKSCLLLSSRNESPFESLFNAAEFSGIRFLNFARHAVSPVLPLPAAYL